MPLPLAPPQRVSAKQLQNSWRRARPMIQVKLMASGDPEIAQTVLRLQQNHGWLQEDWKDLSPQLDAVAAGESWQDLDTLREGVEVFAALSRDHIALEESCIYPQARARLRASERREMGREMARTSPGPNAKPNRPRRCRTDAPECRFPPRSEPPASYGQK